MGEPGKIAAFDLDGTLVNSSFQIYRSLSAVLQRHLGRPLTPSDVFDNLGQPLNRILDSVEVPVADQPEIIRNFRQNLKAEIINGNEIFPFAIETIRVLRSRNFLIAIATTKPTYLAKLVIEHSDLNGLIDFVQGTDGFPAKPDPEILKRISYLLSSRVEVVFGDRVEDMRAAKSYSTIAVGVAQSAHSIETLLESGADYAFHSFDELLHTNFLEDLLA